LESPDKGNIKSSITFKGTNPSSSHKEKGSSSINDKNSNLNIHNISEYDKKNNKKNFIFNNIKNNGPSFEFKNINSKQTFQGELISEGLFLKNDDILEYIPFKLFSKLLVLITQTYSFNIEKQEVVDRLNDTIKNIVYKAPDNIRDYKFIVEDITKALLIGLKNPLSKNKERLLEWCQVLYKKFQKEIYSNFNVFIKENISSIPADNNTIFLGMIDFLCNIELDKELTILIIKYLSQKLVKEPELMNNESLVILLIEKISKKSSLDIVYEAFSDFLENNKNYTFISKMVNYLNQYLINEPNGFNFRKSLINKKDDENGNKNNELFLKMYKIWSFNPISLIVFCVITEHFKLTYNIILNLIKIQLDNDYYLHLGQLIQLLESNLYDYIRIRLLDPIKNIYLIKALYGILMLLPQGQAYNILSNRMCNVEALFEIENGFNNINEEEDDNEEIDKLIEIFLNNQKLKKEAEDNKNKKVK
jgi:vacuole morphology and inheritance protein 14